MRNLVSPEFKVYCVYWFSPTLVDLFLHSIVIVDICLQLAASFVQGILPNFGTKTTYAKNMHWYSLNCLMQKSHILWQLFNQNNANSKSAKQRSKNRLDWAMELKCEDKEKMCKKLHQWVSRRELVDKVSLCCASLRACTATPGSGTAHSC